MTAFRHQSQEFVEIPLSEESVRFCSLLEIAALRLFFMKNAGEKGKKSVSIRRKVW